MWCNGQGKINFGQGKVGEKSGNFISDLEWAPCKFWFIYRVTPLNY